MMKQQSQSSPKPRRRVRKEPPEWVIKFAPPPVEGQLHFEFDFEPDEEEKEDE